MAPKLNLSTVKWKGADALAPHLVPLSSVHQDPRNARAHPRRSIDAIRDSFARFGQVKPVVVDAAGKVIAGNGGVQAAQALGWTHVAAVTVKMTDAEAKAYALVDNRSAEFSEWSPNELLAQLQELDPAAQLGVGWNDAEMATLLERAKAGQVVEDALAQWSGMPAFDQGDTRAFQSVVVHLPDAAAAERFAKALGVDLTPKTKTLWWPTQNTNVIETGKVYAAGEEPK